MAHITKANRTKNINKAFNIFNTEEIKSSNLTKTQPNKKFMNVFQGFSGENDPKVKSNNSEEEKIHINTNELKNNKSDFKYNTIIHNDRMKVIHPPLSELSNLRQPLTKGENIVLDIFNNTLSDDWEIYIQPHLNGLRPDFVLLNPNIGIGVFEVKDWDLNAMSYFIKKDNNDQESLWAKKDGKEFCIQSQNPISKVKRYKKEIFDLYCPRLKTNEGWGAITEGVIFPFARKEDIENLFDCFIKKDKYPQYQPISGIQEIKYKNIKAIFPESKRTYSKLMSEDLASDLRGWLVEPDFAIQQREPLILDKNQKILAETRTQSGYRRIKGAAGAGKSLVLASRAAKLADSDKSVLILSYNITLWHYLRDMVVRGLRSSKAYNNIQFSHFHLWCKDICYGVGWDKKYESLWIKNKDDVLNYDLPSLAEEAIDIYKDKIELYDAILVDEGQDYKPNWWNMLRKICKDDGEMILVADATQDIYDTAKEWTDDTMKGCGFSGVWSQLGISYRLPPDILQIAKKFAIEFLPEKNVDLPNEEQGSLNLYPCYLRWVQVTKDSSVQSCLDEIIALMKFTGKNNLANSDITVLCLETDVGADLAEELDKKNIHSINTYGEGNKRKKMAFYMGDARIKMTTVHSFKGWESRLMVIFINQELKDPKSFALLYTGLTRLKRDTKGSYLTVVCADPNLSEFGKNFTEYKTDY